MPGDRPAPAVDADSRATLAWSEAPPALGARPEPASRLVVSLGALVILLVVALAMVLGSLDPVEHSTTTGS